MIQLDLFENNSEVDEISTEDLEATSSYFSNVAYEARMAKAKKEAKKIVAILDKRIATADKKINGISTEITGNYTPKRSRERDQRVKQKEQLQIYATGLKRLRDLWDKGEDVPKELQKLRSINDFEYLDCSPWMHEPDENAMDWAKERYESWKKTAVRLGVHDAILFNNARALSRELSVITISEEEKQSRELQKEINAIRGRKIPGFFPTPDKLIDKMFDEAFMFEKRDMLILEPSAGIGNIAERVLELDYGHTVDCVEVNYTLYKILELKGLRASNMDIFELDGHEQYDRVIMNPPFERSQDIKHIMYCYENFLKPGGTLVSIASAGSRTRDTKPYQEFRTLVFRNGFFVELEGKEFVKAFNPTGVITTLVVIKKPL